MPASMKHLKALKENRNGVNSVLARWAQNGLYYQVDVLDCESERRKCLVKFEDDHQCWLSAQDLHIELSFEDLKEENIVCCVCDDGTSKVPNEIVMCDFCQQGYHLNCHGPPIDRSEVNMDDDESEWTCSTCTDIYNQSIQQTARMNASVQPKRRQTHSCAATPKVEPNLKTKRSKTSTDKASKSARKATPSTKIKLNANSNTSVKPRKLRPPSTPPPMPALLSSALDTPESNVGLTPVWSQRLSTDSEATEVSDLSSSIGNELSKHLQISPKVEKQTDTYLIKTEVLGDNNTNDVVVTSNDLALVGKMSEQLHKGNGRVERMEPLIIKAAQVLVEETSNVGTKDFVNLISADFDCSVALKESTKKSKPKGVNKDSTDTKKKTTRKYEKVAAAAY